MDFMHDVPDTAQTAMVFTPVDMYTRVCVALEGARSFSGSDAAHILSGGGERSSDALVSPSRGPKLPYSPALRRSARLQLSRRTAAGTEPIARRIGPKDAIAATPMARNEITTSNVGLTPSVRKSIG